MVDASITLTGVAGTGRAGTLLGGPVTLPSGVWYARITATLGYNALTKWSASASIAPGTLRRQNAAPTAGNERVFVAIQSATGTTGGSEPTWAVRRGATTIDNTVTWMEATGQAVMNGDLTNGPNWTAAKASGIALGTAIQNNAGTFLFICSTPGVAGSGSEPTWNTTAGQTTADNTVTWTSIGAVGNFGQWAAPHARLTTAFAQTWALAGDTIYVGSDHAETSTASGLSSQGTAAAPVLVFCIPTGTIPPVAVATGASITFAAGNISLLTTTNSVFLYGVSFTSGNIITIGIGGAVAGLYFESCTFKLTGANTSVSIGTISSGAGALRYHFRACNFIMSSATQSVKLAAGLATFVGCTFFSTLAVPTTAFTVNTGQLGTFRIRACDITTGATTALFNASPISSGTVSFENCRLSSSGTTLSTGAQAGQFSVLPSFWSCDAAANYALTVPTYMGTVQHSTIAYRVGGASNGNTPMSWQIISSANTELLMPYVSPEIFKWNGSLGISKTATICFTSSTGALTNNDVWIELEYLGSAASPLGTSLSTRAALLAAGSPLSADVTSTWVSGLGNNYQITASFTQQLAGVVKVRVHVGTPNLTINVDPVIAIT